MADASLLFWRRAAESIGDKKGRIRDIPDPSRLFRRPAWPAAQPSSQINIELPADTEATYSNFAIINHSPSEIVIDFARLLPNIPTAKVHAAQFVMTPLNAKLLLRGAPGQPEQIRGAVRRDATPPNDAGFEAPERSIGFKH